MIIIVIAAAVVVVLIVIFVIVAIRANKMKSESYSTKVEIINTPEHKGTPSKNLALR